ncbi:MAG: methylthioribulose-1-phosphate dehydratase [Gammaproteobacteria bacterium]|nr:MAG: methylthioribulose-1-phosphate dehydratase [Gammaproteobacteria bacterium]TND02211.1 MAG: methylthioribulose-1-phosphate dehydratase [Gammaproteobacteria bacterium]
MSAIPLKNFEDEAQALVSVGLEAFARGWVPATSGNFSVRLGPNEVAITVSGRHKGRLTTADIMRVDGSGRALDKKRPSAETLLHVSLYRRFPEVQAVLHTHSVNATVLSRLVDGELVLEQLEVLKAFRGIDTHQASVVVPVFANDQDIQRLASTVDQYLEAHGPIPGYLIAGHGLYTWGASLNEAMRHLEAFEFLLQCELEMRRASRP